MNSIQFNEYYVNLLENVLENVYKNDLNINYSFLCKMSESYLKLKPNPTIMYISCLKLFLEKIPNDYPHKNTITTLLTKIINDLNYIPPEIITSYFSNKCSQIIPYLSEDNKTNKWCIDGWSTIEHTAKKCNKILQEIDKVYIIIFF